MWNRGQGSNQPHYADVRQTAQTPATTVHDQHRTPATTSGAPTTQAQAKQHAPTGTAPALYQQGGAGMGEGPVQSA